MVAVVIAVTVVGAANAATETQVKPGLWEIKLVKQWVDGRDVTPLVPAAMATMQQMMANMTPQQRRQMEATLGKPPTNTTQRICVSPEMAAGDKPMMPADVKCEPTSFSRTGNRVVFEFSCADQGRTTTGNGQSVLSSESVSTRIDMVTSDANGRHTLQTESLSRFVSADCGKLKPADQVLQETQNQKN